MKLLTAGCLVMLVVASACTTPGTSSTAALTSQTASTYTLADGRAYSGSDCPSTANLLIGGNDAADALPLKGQTDRARVEAILIAVSEQHVAGTDVVEVRVVPRNGEVWYRLDNGDHAVEKVEDYQFEFILAADGSCPTAPHMVDGIPVLYTRADA